MARNETHCSYAVQVLRSLTLVGGGVFIIVALMADRVGLGVPGSLGSGQVLLLAAGIILVLIGTLGRRIVALYRGTAIVVCNTLLLLGCLELGAIAISRVEQFVFHTGSPMAKYTELPYYRTEDWSGDYFRELASYAGQMKRYYPYVVWRESSFAGTTTVVDHDGLRQTPGADCRSDAYTIFAFGGSTMWGWGAPDWGTIPAYLQSGFAALKDGPVCVVNFGQNAFVSTQSLLELLMQLLARNVPDVAVFYSGINNVYAAYQSGQPRVHVELDKIAARFETPEHPLVEWFKASRQFALLAGLVPRRGTGGVERSHRNTAATLADAVVQNYLGLYRIVGALAQAYGFEYSFFWQPAIAVSGKSLTRDEQKMQAELEPALVELYQAVYQRIESIAHQYPNLHNLARVLDNQQAQIWIDHWSHVTPVGNKLIAEAMLNAIKKRSAVEEP